VYFIQYEKRTARIHASFDSEPSLGKERLSIEQGAKLLWPVVVRYKMRQGLEAGPVTPSQNHTPVVLLVAIPKHPHPLREVPRALRSIHSGVADQLLF
jgi:hypothetical protein